MTQSRARGKVQLGIDRLASAYPFHAGILARWVLIEDPAVGTMAVGLRHARIALLFAPAFVESISLSELVGVLHHEANHCVAGHILHEPVPGENRAAWVVSCETVANEFVPEPLPGKPVLLSDFPYLPENEDTETRYDRLKNRIKDTSFDPVDNHDLWEEIQRCPSLAKALTEVCMAGAWEAMSDQQRASLPKALQDMARKAGKDAGNRESALGGGTACLPWPLLLKRYVGQATSRRPMFGRVPRRYPSLCGVIPGKGRSASRPKVLAAIDTSGSLTNAMLSEISAELEKMSRTHSVVVAECDTQIHAVYSYKPIRKVHGRGGTSLKPPLEASFLRKHKVDVAVYFTDGDGPAPASPPRVPVVWCLVPGGSKPVSWGREIRMEPLKSEA